MSNGDVLSDGITSAEGRLLSVHMGSIRDDVREVKETMRGMATSLEKLVRIEEQQKEFRAAQERAFAEIRVEREKREANERRIGAIEQTLPGLREARGWAITCALGTFGAIAIALVSYFFQWHVR